MKLFRLFIALFVVHFVTGLNAQTIYTTPENYNHLKSSGKLNPKARYEFLISKEKSSTVTSFIPSPVTKTSRSAAKTATSSGGCACMVPLDPTFTVTPFVGFTPPDYRNDDGCSPAIPLGFNFCFYGTTYTSCFINNNGNITFVNDLAAFSAGGFPAGNATSLDTIMIAPFWGDVDTQNPASGLVYYKKTPTALIVKWDSVGYFSSQADKRNNFQLIITDGTDPILPNGSNVAFCYGDMQWTTGSASSGVGGFGGIPATAGVNKGDHINYVQLGRFDQAGLSYDGPYGLNDGVSFLDNKSYFFNTCGTNNNLPPIIQDATGGGSACGDTIRICALGDTLVYTTSFLAPEGTQSITVNGSAPTLGGSFQPLSVTTTTAGITTYAWMIVATPSVTGVHTVVITGTDNGLPPLSSSATYYIKIQNLVVPQPTLSISPTGTVCATPGATISLVNCSSYDNVYWSNGNSGCSTIVNSSGIVFVTVSKLGCYKSSSDTITVFPNPVPVIFGPLNYCPPLTSTTLSINPPLTGMPAYSTYTWAPGSIMTPTASLTAGIKTLTITDINGCKGSVTFSVSASAPTLSITADPISICGTGTITLTGSISGATSYSWSTGATTQTTTVSAAGNYSLNVTSNSCVSSAVKTVSINAVPTVTLPATVGLCSGSSATIAPLSIVPTGAYSYTWSNGAHASVITVTTPTILTLQVTDVFTGCVSTISNSVTVLVAPSPTVTLGSLPVLFCNGSSAVLTPTISSGTPAFTYSWSPAALGAASTATTNTVGTYTVRVTDQNLCKGIASVSVIKSTPGITLVAPDTIICKGDCIKIKAIGSSSYTPGSYTWSNNNANTSDSAIVCSTGSYTVSFIDGKGCAATKVKQVVDDVLPTASFVSTPPSPVTPGQIINFTNTSTIPSGTLSPGSWSFGDGTGATGNAVTYSYQNAGTYAVTLVVTGSSGCVDTVSVNYVVDATIRIPNVITPNGDGINDSLKFNNLQVFGTNNITIFNRWGKKIYEQDNYKNDWGGGGYSDGTYFFILNVPESSPNTYSGYFQIIH